MTSVSRVLFQSHPSLANGNVSSSGPSIPRDPPGTSPILIGSPWKRSNNKWPVKVPITYPKKVEEDKWFQILWDSPETPPKRPHFVKTELLVKKTPQTAVPEPCCAVCRGGGRVHCERCQGRGRSNHVEMAMLPKGVWPQWCWYCRGSGLSCCARCMGSGERRGIIGFHVPAV